MEETDIIIVEAAGIWGGSERQELVKGTILCSRTGKVE